MAFVTAVLLGAQKPTQLGYVALLLGLAFILGFLAALARGHPEAKKALSKLGYRMEPEGSIYAQTLAHMSEEATVLIELKDGRRVSGCPRNGPQHKDDGINELYLVYPEVLGDDGVSKPIPGGAGRHRAAVGGRQRRPLRGAHRRAAAAGSSRRPRRRGL